MRLNSAAEWQPPVTHTGDGNERRVGVELEFAGVEPQCVLESLQTLYGGEVKELSRAEFLLEDTCFGEFKLELDANAVKSLAGLQDTAATSDAEGAGGSGDEQPGVASKIASSVGDAAVDLLTSAAEQLVPWEVVSPPIAVGQLHRLAELVDQLREHGALGTRHAVHYAFGLHLNPELPALDATTIRDFLRAYFCLYDWIVAHEQIDTMRKITPYINHFGKDYISRVLDPAYAPDTAALIDDYLAHNPTRNRSLDMLPLFAHLDEARVRAVVDDSRVKSRPTFHYRLPNCDIDNAQWNLDVPWRMWLEVEKLAANSDRLEQMCELYAVELARLTHSLEGRWASQVGELLARQ